jgi:cytochrome c oxidase assembly protein subunit 15
VVWLGRGLASAAGVVLALGTVVTGTGPHAGDAKTTRLPFDLRDVTQLHADAALLLTGLAVATLVAMRIADVPAHVARRGRWLVAAILLQVAIGYAQYFSGLPAGVVELHIAGATVLWTVTLWLNLGFTTSGPVPVRIPEPVGEAAPRTFRRRIGAAGDRLTPTPPR